MDKLEQRTGQYQVKKSKGIVDAAIRATSQDLLSIKLKNEQFQKQTYADELVRQQIRQQQILDEAKLSTQKNLGMEMNWEKLKEIDECEELYNSIQDQIKMFNEIINGKESLIREFWEELKKKDDQYIKMLKEQQIEIKDIVTGMRTQFYEIRDANLRELQHIEEQFDKEREQMIRDNKSEIEDLFSRHDKEELQYLKSFTDNDDNNFEKIEELRIMGAKAYAKIKIEMEGEIQNLQKCLEDMNALYILNTEKLDYNLKVLKEKNDENKSLQEELKRKDGLLQNRLRILTNDYNSQKIEFRKRNKLLTQEYKRITLQFMELQKKFKHFEKADSLKYTEIQKMNEEEVRKYKSKIIQCDLTIHNQQLGKQRRDDVENEDESQYNQNQQSPEKEQDIEENRLKFSEERVKEIVDILLEEGGFLIDDKMADDLSKLKPSESHRLITDRMDTIKKCLGIEDSIIEFNLFLERLISRCRVKSEEELIQEQNEKNQRELMRLEQEKQNLDEDQESKKNEKKNQQDDEPSKESINRQEEDVDSDEEEVKKVEEKNIDLETVEINKNKVIEFMIKWVSKSENRKKKLAEENNNKRQQKQESEREKKERIARKGKQYWENLTNVLPARTFRIWKVLDKALSKYYELLLSRQKIIDETGELHNQNEELKNLLNQYLQINHELQIPPTRLINLEQN